MDKGKNPKQHSIALIICWYGPYPWYMAYFLHSCAYNPTIDFFIITDNKSSIPNKPANVRIVFNTISNIKRSAKKKFGFSIKIDSPYKFCDFKPAYGFLFSNIIECYDFWGHSDIDVIYGDIRNFITEDILSSYEVISSRHDYISGTFSLFKNNNKINMLFSKSRDFKKVFGSSEHFCFDECNYLFSELQMGNSILDYPENIQSMTYVVREEVEKGNLKAFFDFIIIEGTPGKIKWNRGKITYKDLYECMYYHLVKFKTICKQPKLLDTLPSTFYFTPTRIISIS